MRDADEGGGLRSSRSFTLAGNGCSVEITALAAIIALPFNPGLIGGMVMKFNRNFFSLLLGAALAMPAPAWAAPVKLAATLAGAAEPGGGDTDGSGAFSAEVDAQAGDFCYTLSADNIAKATMAHVHSGAAGANGPPVAKLDLGSDLCIAVEPDVLKAIVAAPGNYYVNVHNAEFPGGAVRGQLAAK
jgi:CHRD domain